MVVGNTATGTVALADASVTPSGNAGGKVRVGMNSRIIAQDRAASIWDGIGLIGIAVSRFAFGMVMQLPENTSCGSRVVTRATGRVVVRESWPWPTLMNSAI